MPPLTLPLALAQGEGLGVRASSVSWSSGRPSDFKRVPGVAAEADALLL